MAGRMINGAAGLAALVRPAGDTAEPGVHRVLPVVPELSGLLPGRGLRRGSTVAVATGGSAPGSGGTSLLLALLAAASRSGSWCAVVGVPSLGVLAAAENGIALDRLALIPNPGPEWPTVVAALIDGVDVVVTAVPGPVSAAVAGRLAARARQRGSVLMPFGRWTGADVTLQVTHGRWEGLGRGRGRLRRRVVTVLARGRGAATRPKETTMWMPGVTVPTSPGFGVSGPGPSGATPDPVVPSAAAPAPSAVVPGPCAADSGSAGRLQRRGGPVDRPVVLPGPSSPSMRWPVSSVPEFAVDAGSTTRRTTTVEASARGAVAVALAPPASGSEFAPTFSIPLVPAPSAPVVSVASASSLEALRLLPCVVSPEAGGHRDLPWGSGRVRWARARAAGGRRRAGSRFGGRVSLV